MSKVEKRSLEKLWCLKLIIQPYTDVRLRRMPNWLSYLLFGFTERRVFVSLLDIHFSYNKCIIMKQQFRLRLLRWKLGCNR